MNTAIRLSIALGAAGVTMLGAWVWIRLRGRRRKGAEELERMRRLDVNRRGRISAGKILESIEPNPRAHARRLVLYKYEVAGVTYEAAQDISGIPGEASGAQYLVGQAASIKYDPKNPSNSIIACEEWTGLPEKKPGLRVRRRALGVQTQGPEPIKD